MLSPALSLLLQEAIGFHQANRFDEAERAYRQILKVAPQNFDALHLLGVIASQRGFPVEAIALISAALQVVPGNHAAWLNLGNACDEAGDGVQALRAYTEAVRLQPSSAEARNNRGVALRKQGRRGEAIAEFRQATALAPAFARGHLNLAATLQDQGEVRAAIEGLRMALTLTAPSFELWSTLAALLTAEGETAEAIEAYRRSLEFSPGHVPALNNLGNLLESAACFAEAEAVYRGALAAEKDAALVHNNLANLLKDLGRVEEALVHYRQVVAAPGANHVMFSNLLIAQQYTPSVSLAALYAAHVEFDRRFAQVLGPVAPTFRNLRQKDRRLRVGFISPHFEFHAVGHFLIRILENLSSSEFELCGFSDTPSHDSMTARIRGAMHHWIEIAGLSDETVAERVRSEQIDILFDLAGHTAGNRLLVFARKPAPIQISWLDYVGTTGLSAIDYLLADPQEIPSNAEPFYRETVLRMAGDYICYDPPREAPPVNALPALANGFVTFASFNLPSKTTPNTVATWGEILRRVPGARLVLKNRTFDNPHCQSVYARLFREAGVAERVQFQGWEPPGAVLRRYGEVDLALDTFPYNGGLTTCEALWMGVPVVTLAGETFAGRHGLTHLSAAGLREMVATSVEEYIALACQWASDLPRLSALRATLRPQVESSPLCDGARAAESFAGLLRRVWSEWVDRNP